jgi:tetratricopeptide (TPR) repeat protein
MLGFASGAFFLLLAPTSSFVPVAGQPIAENRIYLPLACIAAAAVVAGHAAAPRRGSLYASAAMLAGFGWLTHQRNADLQSELRIWQDTVSKHPANVRAWGHLSMAQMRAGRLDDAIKTTTAAIALTPHRADLYNNAGVYLSHAGRKEEAIAYLRTAVRLNPDGIMAYHSLARVLVETNDLPGAEDCYQAILRIDPADAKAHNYLGVILARTGRPADAIPHFEAALKSEPELREAQTNLEATRKLLP